MSQVGRISGPLLEANLERNGVDLAFRNDLDTTQLLYLDVNNGRIGINTSTPTRDLEINGTVQTVNLITTTSTRTPGFDISSATFSAIGNIELNAAEAIVFANFENGTIRISDNAISTIDSNADVDLTPSGTGTTEVINDLNVYGDIYTPGTLTFGGTITFGNETTDTVDFNADVTNNLIPDQNDTYNLGSLQKRWDALYTNFVNGQSVATDDLIAGLINFNLRNGNIFYVSSAGTDTNSGTHYQDPFASVSKALEAASAITNGPVVIRIFPGEYQEQLPLVVPSNVSVIGDGIRSVTILPNSSSQSEDVFLLNGETTVANLTIKDFYYDSVNNTGHAFRFAPNAITTTRSPYIQNISVITQETSLGSFDAGRGAWIDGSEMNLASFDASMLFHSCTFITPNADAITMTNGVRVEWLNSFTYFANRGLYAVDGLTGRTSQDGSTVIYGAELRAIGSASVYGNYGAVADGSDTLMYLIQHNFGYIGSGLDRSNDRTLAIQENEVVKLNGGKIYYQTTDHIGAFRVGDNFLVDLETGKSTIDISSLSTESLSGLIISSNGNATVIDGTKIESGNIRFTQNRLDSLVGDLNIDSATGVLNFNDNTSVNGNIIIRDNFSFGGTLNIKGDEAADRITFNVEFDQDFNPNQHQTFNLGSLEKQWLNINLSKAEVGNITIFDNVITSSQSNSNLEIRASETGKILIPNNTVQISNNVLVNGLTSTTNIEILGLLDLSGTLLQTGNVSISSNADVGQNLDVSSTAQIDGILIDTNFISTTASNADLELRASGTGKILIPNNVTIVTESLSADNILANANVTVTAQTAFNISIVSNLNITENYITSNASNADLDLKANGSGKIVLLDNTTIPNDYSVYGINTFKDSVFAQGFGPQLVVNGTYSGSTLTGWTLVGGGNAYVDNNELVIEAPLNIAQIVSQNISVTPGALYQFSVSLLNTSVLSSSADYSLRVFESGVGDRLAWNRTSIELLGGAPITLSGSFVAQTSIVSIVFRCASASARWDNVSLIQDLGIIETITPIEVDVQGTLTQNGDRTQTGNYDVVGNASIDGTVNISSTTEFINYTIDNNVIENRRFGLSPNRSSPSDPLGFYSIVTAMAAGATADDYPNQTEKNLINFLANGTLVENDYAFSYVDVNQNGASTTSDAISWLQFIANGTTGDAVIDSFIEDVVDELITIEFNNPGTFNKDVLLFGDYFEPNIVLQANGTGLVILNTPQVELGQNLSSNQISVDNNTVISNQISANNFTNNIIQIDDNFVQTEISNADLELRSTRQIVVPLNDLIIENNLNVLGSSAIKNANVVDNIQHTGNRNQTGNFLLNGNLVATSLGTTGGFNFNSISTAGNVISSLNSNENLELRANGSGTISIADNDVLLGQDLTSITINGNSLNAISTIESNKFLASNNIEIFNNVIKTTESNSNLELRTINTSKHVSLENLIINQSTISTTSSNIELDISNNLNIESSSALIIPKGLTAQRNTATGNIRFNTTDSVFEGFVNNNTVSFNGIYSANRRTSVLAHPTNNEINFRINASSVGTVSSLGLAIHGIQTDDINFNLNRISTTVSNSNLELRTNGTGELVIDNISLVENTIKNNSAGALTFENENLGLVKFASDRAVAIPFGTTAERPANPEVGTARWNTDEDVLEVWDGSVFATAAGSSETINSAEFQDLMLEYTLIFG